MIEKERTNVIEKAKSGGLAFFAMTFFYVLLSFVGNSLLNAFGVKGTAYRAVCSLFSVASLVFVGVFFGAKQKDGLLCVTKIKKFKPVYAVAAVMLGIGMIAGLGFVNEGVILLLRKIGLNVSVTETSISSPTEFALYVFLIAFLPAVSEECFFRGVLLCLLCDENDEPFGRKTVVASLTVAICFSLYHASFAQLVYQFIYGLFLCFLTIKAKSVIPPVIAHFMNNFIVLLCSYVGYAIELFNVLTIISGLFVLAAFILLLVFAERKKDKSNRNVADKSGVSDGKTVVKSFWVPFGIVGAAVFILLIVGGIAV